MTSRVLLKGVAFELRTCALIVTLYEALELRGLVDIVDTLHRVVFKPGGAFDCVPLADGSPAWRLRPWPELTLTEILHLCGKGAPTPLLRMQIVDLLVLAEYIKPEAPTC